MADKLSQDSLVHTLFAAFHDHRVPMKRDMCEELRSLIQQKRIQGKGSIKALLQDEEAKKHCSKQLLHAISLVTEPLAPPLPVADAPEPEPEPRVAHPVQRARLEEHRTDDEEDYDMEVSRMRDDQVFLENARRDMIVRLCKDNIHMLTEIIRDHEDEMDHIIMSKLKQVKANLTLTNEVVFRSYYL